MALREILKDDTSKSIQTELSDMQKPIEVDATKDENSADGNESANVEEIAMAEGTATKEEPESKGEKRKIDEGDNDQGDEGLKKAKIT